ncbi:small secreted protein [Actinacidiphila bryophytorum]|uniref:small secreted protein n=1 Tax=Actinacidiphila bryophytorum TaxID=1436133 RepID=UPI002AFFEB73|nr:small secreted protein [Actinacidiphila bryophytorum]
MKVNHRLGAALSCAAAVLALSSLSACSSDDTGKKLDTWAKGVCDQTAAQTKKINDANTALTQVDSGGRPEAVRAADSAAFQQISDAYKALAGIFSQAGAAPGDDGAQFQQKAVTSLTTLSTQYAGLKKQVDALDTTDQNKFADGLQGVSDSFKQTSADGEKALSSLRTGDQGKALAKQPGCQSVSGTTAPSDL